MIIVKVNKCHYSVSLKYSLHNVITLQYLLFLTYLLLLTSPYCYCSAAFPSTVCVILSLVYFLLICILRNSKSVEIIPTVESDRCV